MWAFFKPRPLGLGFLTYFILSDGEKSMEKISKGFWCDSILSDDGMSTATDADKLVLIFSLMPILQVG